MSASKGPFVYLDVFDNMAVNINWKKYCIK